ncbi:MAG TPA: ABC transporter permease [Candidatus Saccharimonadales bacterium]|nr:ABC transporter permease [Candidatus Saccharimonadales bacterium]
MELRESLALALGALRANKLRSFLTLLGNIVGVMSVIAIVAIIQGMNHYVSDKLLEQGSNVFYVDKFGAIFNEQDYLDALKRKEITLDDRDALLERCPSVKIVAPWYERNGTAHFRQRHTDCNVRGFGENYPEINGIDIAEGRHLTLSDMQRRSPVCVIGQETAQELFENLDPLGREVRVGDHAYTVVGVGARKGKILGQSQDNYVIMPYTAFLKQYGPHSYLVLAIKSTGPETYLKAQDEVRVILRARRHVPYAAKDDFGLQTAEMFMELYSRFTGGAFIVMIGVASLALVVGGIVIMNIMLVSVTERTREIGVRKAVGARGGDLLQQFLLEAVTLSCAGGVIGILVGAGIALLISSATPLPARVEPWSVLIGLVVASSVGLFFGIYPAMRAARLDPIEALRYE